MKKKGIFIFLTAAGFTLHNYTAKAQFSRKIKVQVIDSISKAPLPHASIVLQSTIDKALVYQAQSGQSGNFVFEKVKQGSYLMSIKYVGYKNYDIFLNLSQDTVLVPIKLALALKGLKTVSIIAKKPYIVQAFDKVTLNVSESPAAGGSTALDVLQVAPGVQISQSGEISLKGKAANVYIDGKPSHLSGDDLKVMLSSMSSRSIDKIELMSNPSVKYDADASAIINIKTVYMLNYGFNGTFSGNSGSGEFARYGSGASFNYKQAKYNIYGSYDYGHVKQLNESQNYRLINSGGMPVSLNEDRNDIRSRNANAFKIGTDYDLNKTTSFGILIKTNIISRSRAGANSTPISTISGQTDSLVQTSINGKSSYVIPSFNAYYKKKLNKAGANLIVNADYYRYNKSWSNNFDNTYYAQQGTVQTEGDLRDNSPGDISIKSATVDYENPTKFGKWEAGIKSSYTTTDNDVNWQNYVGNIWVNDLQKTNHFQYNENVNAIYGGINKTFKKFTMQLMLRGEQTNVKGNNLTIDSAFNKNYLMLFPSVAVSYAASQKNQFALSYRKSIERPNYEYVNPFIIFQSTYSYFQGNPNINPMVKHSFDLNYSYNYTLFTTLTYSYINNFFGSFYRQNNESKVLINYYDNYKSAQSVTLNFALSKMLKSWWVLNANVGLNYFKGSYTNVQTEKSSPSTYITASNIITMSKTWTAEVTGLYNTGYSDGFYTYKPMGLLNIGVQKNLVGRNTTIKLSANDILNSYKIGYSTQYQQINMSTSNRMDTRYIMLTLGHKFGNSRVAKKADRKQSIDSEVKRIAQ